MRRCVHGACNNKYYDAGGWVPIGAEVDDLIVTGTNTKKMAELQQLFQDKWGVEKWGDVHTFHGMRCKYDRSAGVFAGWLPYQANRFSSTNRGQNHLSRCTQPESRRTHRPAPVLSGFLPPKESVGRVIGRCVRRDSGCVHRERCFLNELKVAA